MPRSARLKNVGSGLCGSFASRNSDPDGYWSIGKLRSLGEQHGWKTVSLDVLTSSMQPSSCEFDTLLARYRHLLSKLADVSGIERVYLAAAITTVDFAQPPWRKAGYYEPQWRAQFVLTVTIHAQCGAAAVVRHAGYCRPHDPARERQSTRRSAYEYANLVDREG